MISDHGMPPSLSGAVFNTEYADLGHFFGSHSFLAVFVTLW